MWYLWFCGFFGGQPGFQWVQSAPPHLSHPQESFAGSWAALLLPRLADSSHLSLFQGLTPNLLILPWLSLPFTDWGQPGSCRPIWSLLLTRNAISSPKQRSGHTLRILSSCITSGGVFPAIWTPCTETFDGKNGIASREIKICCNPETSLAKDRQFVLEQCNIWIFCTPEVMLSISQSYDSVNLGRSSDSNHFTGILRNI